MLFPEEQKRYQKHLLLPQIGQEGQQKLKDAKVLVVGAGGLGCPVLLYLAAAGVGKIGIVDGDSVDLSNLQRQVLYQTQDINQPKAQTAVTRLKELNYLLDYQVHLHFLKEENATEIIQEYDLVVDCTDNFAVRYLINDVCVQQQKPFVYGAIHQFEGQVSVFNYQDKEGNLGPTYRCLFPEEPSQEEIPNCTLVGVMGILPGVIGTYQATEVIKIITGIGKVLSGQLLMLDLLENTQQKIKFKRRKDAEQLIFPAKEPIPAEERKMKTISVEELEAIIQVQKPVFLLDVRNPFEYDICHLENAVLIPMNTIPDNAQQIPQDLPVIVYCHHGQRSASVIDFLEQKYHFKNLYNLTGGIHAWAVEVDIEMDTY